MITIVYSGFDLSHLSVAASVNNIIIYSVAELFAVKQGLENVRIRVYNPTRTLPLCYQTVIIKLSLLINKTYFWTANIHSVMK